MQFGLLRTSFVVGGAALTFLFSAFTFSKKEQIEKKGNECIQKPTQQKPTFTVPSSTTTIPNTQAKSQEGPPKEVVQENVVGANSQQQEVRHVVNSSRNDLWSNLEKDYQTKFYEAVNKGDVEQAEKFSKLAIEARKRM